MFFRYMFIILSFYICYILMTLDPKVWGPHYWFVLHTIAMSYPIKPNDVIKKKYYDFIQNIPLFLPIEDIGNNFSKLLDKYPVTPYLDSRQSLVRWVHFLHNKINTALNLPIMSMEQAMTAYYENYKPKEIKDLEQKKRREKIVFTIILSTFTLFAIYLYTK
jgi:fumarate reductase subunit C